MSSEIESSSDVCPVARYITDIDLDALNMRLLEEIADNRKRIAFLEDQIDEIGELLRSVPARLEKLEKNNQRVEQAVMGGLTKSAERAMVLYGAVKEKGVLKRREASGLLKCHHSEALRAMQETAATFENVEVRKNMSNRWVLILKGDL
jgi:16S rRNA G527 N7-methylase RsmG